MGTAEVQGALWGARSKDWVQANEPAWQPVYRVVLDRAGVGPGTRLLDIGCGAGGALVAAWQRGADVSGIDASEHLVAIARQRLPNASIEVGEMEELPFPGHAFDIVTGMNSFQFAGNILRALREARRVCRRGGTVAMLVWGRKAECDLLDVVLPPVFALLPPAASTAALPLAEPGIIDGLMTDAGLLPRESQDIETPLVFPDFPTAVRAIMSAMARAIRHAGEEVVRTAITSGLSRIASGRGPVILKSRFRLVTAQRGAN